MVPIFMEKISVAMIGCGHSAQQIILNLAKAGVKYWYLQDGDRVEKHNVPTLYVYGSNSGGKKVDHMVELIRNMTPLRGEVSVLYNRTYFDGFTIMPDTMNFYFSTVDNGNTRIEIFETLLNEYVKPDVEPLQWLIDVRVDFDYYEITAINLHDKTAVETYRNLSANWRGRAPKVVCDRRNYIGTVAMIGNAVLALMVNILDLHFDSMVMIKGNSRTRREIWTPSLPDDKVEPLSKAEDCPYCGHTDTDDGYCPNCDRPFVEMEAPEMT